MATLSARTLISNVASLFCGRWGAITQQAERAGLRRIGKGGFYVGGHDVGDQDLSGESQQDEHSARREFVQSH